MVTEVSALAIFKLFRVGTKFEGKGYPFGLFFRYCETLYFFNLTEQLIYYSQ